MAMNVTSRALDLTPEEKPILRPAVTTEDKRAFEELFRRCEQRLGRFLAQIVRDRQLAEDLLQDTFHDAFRDRGRLAAVENEEAWLYGIARNRALNALRRRRRFRSAIDRLVHRDDGRGETGDHELLAIRDLLERHLSSEEGALLILRYLHDFNAPELAAMTGQTPEAIRQRLARAKKKLIAASDGAYTTLEERKDR
jgi:RNA polymerase sigma-70 factor (ECF subfamily)